MIQINATLVLQALHFVIAYAIVRMLLLKPAIKAIHEDRAVQHVLHEQLALQQSSIAQEQLHEQGAWHACQHAYREQAALVSQQPATVIKNITPMISVPSYDDHHLAQLVEEARTAFIKQLER